MLIALAPLLFAVVGALLYALAGNPKAAELGRLTFAAGMIALAFALASHVVKL